MKYLIEENVDENVLGGDDGDDDDDDDDVLQSLNRPLMTDIYPRICDRSYLSTSRYASSYLRYFDLMMTYQVLRINVLCKIEEIDLFSNNCQNVPWQLIILFYVCLTIVAIVPSCPLSFFPKETSF